MNNCKVHGAYPLLSLITKIAAITGAIYLVQFSDELNDSIQTMLEYYHTKQVQSPMAV